MRLGAAVLAVAAALAGAAVGCGGGASAGTGEVDASFYVYFARAKDAREAAAELRESGYSTEIRPDENVEWLVIASRKVEREELEAREGEMRYIAYRHDGDYDGSELGD
jgi:hypothetical protein